MATVQFETLGIAGPAAVRVTSGRRRAIEAAAFVAVWMTAGWLLPIDSNGYLLLGIPLTVVFQVLVRRRPLRELYAAGRTRPALGKRGVATAVALAIVPGWYAVRAVATGEWTLLGWYLDHKLPARDYYAVNPEVVKGGVSIDEVDLFELRL